MGIIVRTAGSNKTKNEIDNDLKNLLNVWNSIKEFRKEYAIWHDLGYIK